jgi:hypothetical protein
MTIEELIKTETNSMIPCYFTLDELKFILAKMLSTTEEWLQSDIIDDIFMHDNLVALIGDKIAHEQEMRDAESARQHEAYLEQAQAAFSYTNTQYSSRYHHA